MFHRTEKSFRIINIDNECKMATRDYSYSLLMTNCPSCHSFKSLDDLEKQHILQILKRFDWNITRSAKVIETDLDREILAAFHNNFFHICSC
ncbi:MAG: hypothetical protein GY790_11945 [Bacteroidetes bacterium]|nr:hypothetical protein [Bacteroidota bacterium]